MQKHHEEEYPSKHLIVSAPFPALNPCNLRNLWM